MAVRGAKTSGRKGFLAGLTLKTSNFLVIMFNTKEAFFNKASAGVCVMEA